MSRVEMWGFPRNRGLCVEFPQKENLVRAMVPGREQMEAQVRVPATVQGMALARVRVLVQGEPTT